MLRDGERVIGTVGLEVAGDAALLRSLAVSTSLRRKGCGRELVAAAEALASIIGVRTLYLLTTTAAPFFARLGYADARRDRAPAAIAALPQFRSICPSTAAFMAKSL